MTSRREMLRLMGVHAAALAAAGCVRNVSAGRPYLVDRTGMLRGTRRFVPVLGMQLRIAETGAPQQPDGPPLLVIPGHTARIEGFDELARHLPQSRRVIVVDLPGCGESDRPDRRYDLTFYEDVLIALLDHLGIDQAVPVGGSLGGNLVLRLGHRLPDRFPQLVLWAPEDAWKAHP